MVSIDREGHKAPQTAARAQSFYFAAWRWHFYAGLFVIPFLLMLAVTGAVMMVYDVWGNEVGWVPNVAVGDTALPPSQLGKAAQAAMPDGTFITYAHPAAPDRPAFFEFDKDGTWFSVAVDPYTGTVLDAHDESTTWRVWAEHVHGTLLIGTLGDRLIEAASSLALVLVATGLYLWWPRQGGFLAGFLPDLAQRGRGWWKETHRVTGVWMSVFLVIFLISGLAWAGVWGDMLVKPWSAFPASKWDAVPLSDQTHADLNHDSLHEVPWVLEATPLPASGSDAGAPAVRQPVVLDTVVEWALQNGFDRGAGSSQFRVSIPTSEEGVYTVSIDGRNGDGFTPSDDRFVHIDRYTGNVLADVRFGDYSLAGKAMAWGIGLHKGEAGWVNFWFNAAYLALVVFLCLSGVVMWWKRRPTGAGRLVAPPLPPDLPMWKGAILVGLAISLAFPMAGISLVAVMAVDLLVLRSLPVLKRALS